MADIAGLRGIRYDLGHIGTLAHVVAPPYDVIDGAYQDILYKRHPANVVRLILNRSESGDNEQNNRYTRAARFLRNWIREGVLFREADPAVYVYHQTFSKDAQHAKQSMGGADSMQSVPSDPSPLQPSEIAAFAPITRRGFMARVRLEPYGTGKIHPHEETHPHFKADRLKLSEACQANLSPIFGIYPDEKNTAQEILEMAIIGKTPIEVTDDEGTCHQMWPVTDPAVISALTGAMGDKPLYIADGHHRYETALTYRDALAAKEISGTRFAQQLATAAADSSSSTKTPLDSTALPREHPANYILMNCVSMNDPGLVVLPTHRLFQGLPAMTAVQLADTLGNYFSVRIDPQHTLQDAAAVWSSLERKNSQGRLAFYTASDQQWVLADITDAGQRKMAAIAPERSPAWRSLGVSILHYLVIDTLLHAPNLPTPTYVRSIDELVSCLTHHIDIGRDLTGHHESGAPFALAALVMPATLEHIRAVCGAGERMPAKSTYFYPKVLSGLVINPLT